MKILYFSKKKKIMENTTQNYGKQDGQNTLYLIPRLAASIY